jgi:hypothetical protein
VFTRIQLALFGAGSWDVVPTLPPELILLPRKFPIHLSKMSYWARTVVVPLLVLCARRPLARNPRGVKVDELYTGHRKRFATQAANPKLVWTVGFNALDRVLKAADGLWPRRTRERATQACIDWVRERLNGVDGLGAIYPAMANSVMMYDCLGYGPDHPERAIARESVERLLVIGEDEAYCQPCVSPVWDTALAAHAMLEAGVRKTRPPRKPRSNGCVRVRCSMSRATGPRNAPACAPAAGPSSTTTTTIPISTTPPSSSWRWTAHAGAPATRPTTPPSTGARNGPWACNAAMAAGARSMPTTPTTI